MATHRLSDPSSLPSTNPGPPPGGGAYLLHLLQQRSSSAPADALHNVGPISFVSAVHASAVEEEQLRCALQQDPAVAALGPSHRLLQHGNYQQDPEFCSDGTDGGRGLLPLQDHPHLQHGHYQHHPLRQSFPGPIRSDQFLPSLMDPVLHPAMSAQNPFSRPYSNRSVDHGTHERMASHSFGHPGLVNPNRFHENLNSSIAHSRAEDSIPPPSYVHGGLRGHNMILHTGAEHCSQDNASNQWDAFSNPQLRASNHSEATRGFAQQGQQLYTQFGSLGVEISSQDHNQDLSFAHSSFQKASFHRKLIDSDDSLPSASAVSKSSRAEGHGSFSGTLMSDEVQILRNPGRRPVSHLYERVVDPITMEDNGRTVNLMDGITQSRFDLHAYGFSKALNDAVTDQRYDTDILTSKESLSISKLKSDQNINLKSLDRKAGNRNGFPHWESAAKDKIDEYGESKLTVTTTQKVQSGHEIQKEKGKVAGWKLKQPNMTGFSEWQSCDLEVRKPNNPPEPSSFTRVSSSVQDGIACLPSGTEIDSAPSSATEQSKQALHSSPANEAELILRADVNSEVTVNEESDETILGCIGFLELDKDNGPNEAHQVFTSKSLREVKRPGNRAGLMSKFNRKESLSRADTEKCTNQFLSIFESLIPPADEELRRRKHLSTLEELISIVWPEARLYLFGSCANAFGVCNSDIDICLSIEGESLNRADIVRKLADVLIANDMQNVQALTHARVPIVKYSDPETGISCDVCVNNMLAVVNTKLLHDYAQIDVRLRQLAFLVKHWAKCRQVNETYRGTLSSYAYVLMCIHFLQQRKPPVLPCLQEMEPTYQVTVGAVKCAYFDKVNRLAGFGQKNKENLADLVALFFEYWAFIHDYSHTVISIRTGRYISKAEKNWTRRIGNERHLICIEDPFEVSHDLGRVVDKHSIRVLRDEFQRAARIMRYSANPWTTLFEPFVRPMIKDDFVTA